MFFEENKIKEKLVDDLEKMFVELEKDFLVVFGM